MANAKLDKRMIALMQAAAKAAVWRGSITYQEAVKKTLSAGGASNIGQGGRSSQPGGPPAVKTGMLRRSFGVNGPGSINEIRDGGLTVRIGTNLPYARIQEYGGIIRPVNVKALPVPIGVEGQRVMREFGGDLRRADLTYIPRKGKDPLLVRMIGKGKNARMQVLFVLKQSVRLPARPYMRPTVKLARSSMQREAQIGARRVMGGGMA